MGLQGATGAQGPVGAAGAQGPVGVTGPQGPPVANYTGNYASTTNYALNDAVSYGGSTYISLVAGNRGNTPALRATQWAVLAAQGATGAQGPVGATGPQGPVGPTGATRATGAQGPPVNFLAAWRGGTSCLGGGGGGDGGAGDIARGGAVGGGAEVRPGELAVVAEAGGLRE